MTPLSSNWLFFIQFHSNIPVKHMENTRGTSFEFQAKYLTFKNNPMCYPYPNLCEYQSEKVPKIVILKEVKNKTGLLGRGRWELLIKGYKVSVMQDEYVLEICCTTLCL